MIDCEEIAKRKNKAYKIMMNRHSTKIHEFEKGSIERRTEIIWKKSKGKSRA